LPRLSVSVLSELSPTTVAYTLSLHDALPISTVINNSVTGMTGNGYTAMRILVGGSAISGDFAFVCADVRGNTLNSSGPMFAANALIADQISSDARFNFPGYAGSANGEFGCVMGTASANLSTYMAGRKIGRAHV